MELRLFLVAALFVVSALAEPLREDLKQLDVAEASLNPGAKINCGFFCVFLEYTFGIRLFLHN